MELDDSSEVVPESDYSDYGDDEAGLEDTQNELAVVEDSEPEHDDQDDDMDDTFDNPHTTLKEVQDADNSDSDEYEGQGGIQVPVKHTYTYSNSDYDMVSIRPTSSQKFLMPL